MPEDEENKNDDITIDTIVEIVKGQLGPIYKDTDQEVLKNIVNMVHDEALYVGNRMYETTDNLVDLKSLIVQCSVIAYQNRGVEGQARQGELGQENHFIDWHQYLQDEVVSHGKRYVI